MVNPKPLHLPSDFHTYWGTPKPVAAMVEIERQMMKSVMSSDLAAVTYAVTTLALERELSEREGLMLALPTIVPVTAIIDQGQIPNVFGLGAVIGAFMEEHGKSFGAATLPFAASICAACLENWQDGLRTQSAPETKSLAWWERLSRPR